MCVSVDTLRAGEGDLTVDVTNNGRQIPVQLHPEGRGTYRVTYTPSGGGVYTIHVHFSGMEVQGVLLCYLPLFSRERFGVHIYLFIQSLLKGREFRAHLIIFLNISHMQNMCHAAPHCELLWNYCWLKSCYRSPRSTVIQHCNTAL